MMYLLSPCAPTRSSAPQKPDVGAVIHFPTQGKAEKVVWEEGHLGCGHWTMPAKVNYPSVSGVWISLVRSVSVNQVLNNVNIPADSGGVLPDNLPSQKYLSPFCPPLHTPTSMLDKPLFH